jgi:hypothetical protein
LIVGTPASEIIGPKSRSRNSDERKTKRSSHGVMVMVTSAEWPFEPLTDAAAVTEY